MGHLAHMRKQDMRKVRLCKPSYFSDIWCPSAGLSLRTDASWYPLLSELLRECDTATCVVLLLLPECPFTTVPELDSACTFDSCGEKFRFIPVP